MMENIKEIPYGIANFVEVAEQNMYYVDKTMYLPLLEKQPRNLFFIRPRCFGKSIFLSMLRAYYDIAQKEKFQKRFGNLWIGSRPTPLQGKFQVVYLDFSRASGGSGSLEENFNNYCGMVMDLFGKVYEPYYFPGFAQKMEEQPDFVSKLNYLNLHAAESGMKLYLIIDEYDNFTNIVLNEQGKDIYHALTHASGFYREIFKKFKGMFERIFMTGVSPVTLDDLTSGFNIGTNYSLSPKFNEMTGFTEEEVREMLDYYRSVLPFNHTTDELIKVMKPWYDNYCFAVKSYGKTTMYNSVMVLNFISNYIDNEYDIPDSMVETNIRIDYDKMRMLIRHDKEFAHDASIIQQLVTQGFVIGTLNENFPAERINDPDPDNFLSLLFYFGMVTIDGTYKGETKFIVPNEVVRDQMYTYLLDTYKENDLVYDRYSKGKLESKLAYDGQFKPYFEYIADCLKKYSSQRDKQKGEAFVHGFTLAMTSQNKFYRPISELDNDGGYADIFLSPLCDIYKDMVDSYIIELKYCKSQTTDEQVKKLFEEASAQISRYADSDMVREAVKTTKLHKLVVIYRGAEMVACEEI